MKQLVLLFSLCSIVVIQANAQHRGSSADYSNAIGVRGNVLGIVGATYQHLFTEHHAFEGIIYTNTNRRSNVTMTALYEYHFEIGAPHFQLYAGGGVHLGIYDRWDYDRDKYWDHGNGQYASPGMDGIIGVEYKFANLPLVVSADLKPYVNFVGGTEHMAEEMGGVSARFTF